MIDIRLLREEFERLKAGVEKKKFTCNLGEVRELDEKWRKLVAEFEAARAKQRQASQGMGELAKDKEAFAAKQRELKEIADKVKELERLAGEAEGLLKEKLLSVPNIPHESVPVGKTEADNKVVGSWGEVEKLVSKHAVPHYDIPWFSKLLDFERGVKVTGAGFPFYVGDMARLVRGLIGFYLDEARKAGYVEFLSPLLVNMQSALGTGALPDKEAQMYEVTKDGFYLIPTAEVPVTNFYRGEILEEGMLPIYHCSYTPCFRREAGSWGQHVRGLNRLHQFDKVEVVKWVHPERSFEELESLRGHAEGLLQKLEIPYRVLLICTGDIGFAHSKQYDLEVYAGGQKRWLEVSSCSNFTDFQARRSNIRFRSSVSGKAEMVHTLNGSALAVPRVLAAILENNLEEDGSVRVPSALIPYTGFTRMK